MLAALPPFCWGLGGMAPGGAKVGGVGPPPSRSVRLPRPPDGAAAVYR